MFKKLISNLPFNPSLLGQVSFYTKRLKAEESIRRLGFAFMALAMFIQMFAVIAPPQKSLAFSTDYIAPNGYTTNKSSVLSAWDNNTNIRSIYSRFGITRDNIVNLSSIVRIRSTDDNLWTTGRSSLSAVSKAGKIKQQYKDGEYSVTTSDGTTIYVRDIKAWDIVNSSNVYDAFRGTKDDGTTFWILKDCGNYTFVKQPPAPTPTPTPTPTPVPSLNPPGLEIRKTIDGGGVAKKPGDQYTYRFEYRNPVQDSSNAENVKITDTLDLTHYDIVSASAPYTMAGNVMTINIGSLSYSPGYQTAITLTVKLKTSLDNGLSICNAATLSASNAASVTSGGSSLCLNVINPCPLDSGIPSATDARCTTPALACTLTQSNVNRTTKESTLTTTVASSNPALTHVTSYAYTFGDKSSKTNNSNALTDTVKHTYADGNYSATATVAYYIGSDSKTSHSVGCAADVETKPDQPLTPSKSAQNITQKLQPADTIKTKANAADVIEYTLTTHNSYSYDRANYTISDSVGDIADYADIDQAFLASQGGTYDNASKTVSWASQTVKANSDMVNKFRVTVKNPVPSTNQPSALTTSFDCIIGNKYGTEVSIPINCPPAKTAEYIATTLPNTGAGTSVLIGAAMMVVVAYFFYRSRLLGKELQLVRAEYATGGGF